MPRRRNLITDVPGIKVGNAQDEALRSGVTVLLGDAPMTAAVDIRGGGPGTRETRLLEAEGTVEQVHGLVLSGGSAFGLDAATGVQSWLREKGNGFAVGDARVPIVPQAILFDLLNGGEKDWGKHPPYRNMAYAACSNADLDFALGTSGAGFGATTATFKGGLGSASKTLNSAITVGALVVVNAVGSATLGSSKHFWAAPSEQNKEFGGHGLPQTITPDHTEFVVKSTEPGQSTTLAIVATDAALDQAALKRVAIMAHTGMARAIHPVHTPLDGDIAFAVSTGQREADQDPHTIAQIGNAAATTLARAIARGIYEARSVAGEGTLKAYRDVHPTAQK